MDITALGEILIDYTPMPKSLAGMQVFEQNPGGAPANVLACAARLGRETAFIGKIGCDMQGEFLRQTLIDAGIDDRGVISDPDYFTTLAFVSLSPSGERSFAFARKPGADTRLRADELDGELLGQTAILHVGSLSLTDEPARTATLRAIETAKAAGAVISYDPNYRPLLWASEEAAIEQMRSILSSVDLIKISDEETALLTGEAAPEAAAQKLLGQGIPVVMVTLGAKGALAAKDGAVWEIPAAPANVVDVTGGGNSSTGGFLVGYCESEGDIAYAARCAAVSASFIIEQWGVPPLMDAAFRKQAEARLAALPATRI